VSQEVVFQLEFVEILLRSGNGPLIVVDGVPLDGGNVSGGGDNLLGASSARNPLNLSTKTIESMTVLKDASSTAIYGSRGARCNCYHN
jgi:iron complex outermembrane receptor protein